MKPDTAGYGRRWSKCFWRYDGGSEHWSEEIGFGEASLVGLT